MILCYRRLHAVQRAVTETLLKPGSDEPYHDCWWAGSWVDICLCTKFTERSEVSGVIHISTLTYVVGQELDVIVVQLARVICNS